MQNFTYLNLLEITEQEEQIKVLLKQRKEIKNYSPKKETISNLLNYSKALSIRKSEYVDHVDFILN